MHVTSQAHTFTKEHVMEEINLESVATPLILKEILSFVF